MSEHVNKPEAGLKTQDEIKLKVSSTHASEVDSAHEKIAQEKTANEEIEKTLVPAAENLGEKKASRGSDGFAADDKLAKSNAADNSSFEKISSKGMRRHQMIVNGCVALSLLLLCFSTFDFSNLISQPAYIDESNNLVMEKKKPDLPPSLSYSTRFMVEPEPASDLVLVSKSSWSGRTYGYVDLTGKVVIKPQFHFAQGFSEGLAAVSVSVGNEQKWGFIDRTGAFRIPAKFDNVGTFHNNGLATFSLDREVGLMDKSGKQIVKPEYSYLHPLGNNYIARTIRNKVGVINPQGKWILPPNYSAISAIDRPEPTYLTNLITGYYQSTVEADAKFLKVCKQDLFGIISADGQVVIPPKYDEIVSFSNGIAGVKINGKIGFVDTTGNIIISPKYDSATPFADLIAVEVGTKWHFIDRSGNAVPSPPIDRVVNDLGGDWFVSGLGPIIKDGKVGYVNAKGELAISPQFDVGIPFTKAYAAVRSGDRWHYIDTNGKFVPGYTFGFLMRGVSGKTNANVPGILYPFVQGSRSKNMRDNIKMWITGERPRAHFYGPNGTMWVE